MMQISVLGTGYVGLVTGACLAELGWQVTCIDQDPDKIKQLNQGLLPYYEPGLSEIVLSCSANNTLNFTDHPDAAIAGSDLVFIAVGTPTDAETGKTNLQYLLKAIEDIAPHLKAGTTVIIKSTVPIGTGDKVEQQLHKLCPDLHVHVASNPEFLREGSAVKDFMHPDRIIIGTEHDHALEQLQRLYQPFTDRGVPFVETNRRSAEMIKYAANSFLAMKVTFINEIADLCDASGAQIEDVSHGLGLDVRIGAQHLKPGPGFGGSCFPKDTLSFATYGKEQESRLHLVEATIESNRNHLNKMVEKIITACGGDVKDKTLAVWGLTFKANTDDMRDSPSLSILPPLLEAGASIKAYDKKGEEQAKHYLPTLTYCNTKEEAAEEADAIIIITEWHEFAQFDPRKLKASMKTPTIIDLRNLLPTDLTEDGFMYESVGRPTNS